MAYRVLRDGGASQRKGGDEGALGGDSLFSEARRKRRVTAGAGTQERPASDDGRGKEPREGDSRKKATPQS